MEIVVLTPIQASFMPMIKRAKLTTRKRAVLFREPFQRSRPPEESVSLPVSDEVPPIAVCVILPAAAFSTSVTGGSWETGSLWLAASEPLFSRSELTISEKI